MRAAGGDALQLTLGVNLTHLPARASSMYQSTQWGFAIVSRLITCSGGWPRNNFFIGTSCFFPDSVRGMAGA